MHSCKAEISNFSNFLLWWDQQTSQVCFQLNALFYLFLNNFNNIYFNERSKFYYFYQFGAGRVTDGKMIKFQS